MKQSDRHSYVISLLLRGIKSIGDFNGRLFLVTLTYYCLMFFCNSNITLFLLSLVYFFTVWKLSKNIFWAAFICFLANLPFVKGNRCHYY